MSISNYLKVIGRGARGARSLDRDQAADLFAKVLDGEASDLEIGAFCLAMRVKGETPDEMAGFIDATRDRLSLVPASTDGRPTVILPSYNGARKLPVLTGLLALTLAQRRIRVIVHGFEHDPGRTTSAETLEALGHRACGGVEDVREGVNFVPVDVISPKLHKLLMVRQTIGLRNPAHSLVKIINPVAGRALVIGSYTHAAYALTMSDTYGVIGSDALLIRGIEGEPVADSRKIQEIVSFVAGARAVLQEAVRPTPSPDLDWPAETSALATADYIKDVVKGHKPIPGPIAAQIQHIESTLMRMHGGI